MQKMDWTPMDKLNAEANETLMGTPNPFNESPDSHVPTEEELEAGMADEVEVTEGDFIHEDDVELSQDLGELMNMTWAAVQIFLGGSPVTVTGINYVLDPEKVNDMLCKHLGIKYLGDDKDRDLGFSIVCSVTPDENDPENLQSDVRYFYRGYAFNPVYVHNPDDPEVLQKFDSIPSLKSLLTLAIEHKTAEPKFYVPLKALVPDADPNTPLYKHMGYMDAMKEEMGTRPGAESIMEDIKVQVRVAVPCTETLPDGTMLPIMVDSEGRLGKLPKTFDLICMPLDPSQIKDGAFTCCAYINDSNQLELHKDELDPKTYVIDSIVMYYRDEKPFPVDVHIYATKDQMPDMEIGEYQTTVDGVDLSKVNRASVYRHGEKPGTHEMLPAYCVISATDDSFYLASNYEDVSTWVIQDVTLHVVPPRTPVDAHVWIEPVPGVLEDGTEERAPNMVIDLHDVWHITTTEHGKPVPYGPGGTLPFGTVCKVVLNYEEDCIDFPDNDADLMDVIVHAKKKHPLT